MSPKYKVVRLIHALQGELAVVEAAYKRSRSAVRKATYAGSIRTLQYTIHLLRVQIR